MTKSPRGPDLSRRQAEEIVEWLVSLGIRIRTRIITQRDVEADRRISGHEGGDTIFAIDRKAEPLIVEALAHPPAAMYRTAIVCEGLGPDGRFDPLESEGEPDFLVLIDPIDGTRSLMYDKRSAWFLAAVARNSGTATSLQDSLCSVMVELPTSKQAFADILWATRGTAARADRQDLRTGERQRLSLAPSSETTLRHGFGQVASFFPGTKRLAADLMETIVTRTLGAVSIAEASVFDDQYICSGGQFVELAMGRDRFCCDLRPLFFEILRRDGLAAEGGLLCHPYDVAGWLVARQAGVVLTDGFGAPLDSPFDVHHGVHWCGYANEALRDQIAPVIQAWLYDHLPVT